ncbi:MAG: hypothetical protein K2Y21_07870 [Phycisphaerales bacterium]|nr:hypothetical protein [Phycisphaerales bacterium]
MKWTIASAAASSSVCAAICLFAELFHDHPWVAICIGGFVVSAIQTAVLGKTVLRAEFSGQRLASVFVVHWAIFIVAAPLAVFALVMLVFLAVISGLVPFAG